MTTNQAAVAGAIVAVLVTIVSPPVAALPPTSAGNFDPLFASEGQVVHQYGNNYGYGEQITVLADGKYLLSGRGSNFGVNIGIGFVARFNHDGSYDTSFNGNGRRTFGDDTLGKHIYSTLPLPNGKFVVTGYEWQPSGPNDGKSVGWMTRLNADGSTDSTFGTNGEVRRSPVAAPWLYFGRGALGPNGEIYATSSEYGSGIASRISIVRYTPEGLPDAAFAPGGIVSLDGLVTRFYNYRLRILPNGRFQLTGYQEVSSNEYAATVLRLMPDGSPDASFGTAGKFVQTIPGFSTEFTDSIVAADGSVTLLGNSYQGSAVDKKSAFLVRLDSKGQPLSAADAGGLKQAQALTPLPDAIAFGYAMAQQPDGKLVVTGAAYINQRTNYTPMLARVWPDGLPDPTFGTGGMLMWTGLTSSFGMGVTLDADGKILAAGYQYDGSTAVFVARVIGTEITTPAVEFHNGTLNHYFITADPNEAAAIEAGGAGPGWTRTGQTFKSGGPNRVCRFYGSPDLNPSTGQRRGPNSHFYTIEAEECAAVKTDAGWKFESYDFNGWPLVNGSCPPGLQQIKRVYNQRFAQNDSNHRYVTTDALYQQMIALGWAGEGTVFCAVP